MSYPGYPSALPRFIAPPVPLAKDLALGVPGAVLLAPVYDGHCVDPPRFAQAPTPLSGLLRYFLGLLHVPGPSKKHYVYLPFLSLLRCPAPSPVTEGGLSSLADLWSAVPFPVPRRRLGARRKGDLSPASRVLLEQLRHLEGLPPRSFVTMDSCCRLLCSLLSAAGA